MFAPPACTFRTLARVTPPVERLIVSGLSMDAPASDQREIIKSDPTLLPDSAAPLPTVTPQRLSPFVCPQRVQARPPAPLDLFNVGHTLTPVGERVICPVARVIVNGVSIIAPASDHRVIMKSEPALPPDSAVPLPKTIPHRAEPAV